MHTGVWVLVDVSALQSQSCNETDNHLVMRQIVPTASGDHVGTRCFYKHY